MACQPLSNRRENTRANLWFEGSGNRWRVRLTGCGELISVLYGPCARVRRVTLDPLPQMVANGTAALVSLDRHRFLDHLMGTKT